MRKLAFVLALAIMIAGCTMKSVQPVALATSGQPPAPRPTVTTIVVGDIKVADPLWEVYRPHVVRGITDWYGRNAGAFKVVTAKPDGTSSDAIVLVGTITNIDKGSAAMRWLVGMGAGQAKVNGDFEIQRLDGTALAKFSARESYLGGAGIGGAGFLDMDDLVRRFAETIAETTLKWTRGESLQ